MRRSMRREPTGRRRPEFRPLYGIHDAPEGMLDWAWAVERLTALA